MHELLHALDLILVDIVLRRGAGFDTFLLLKSLLPANHIAHFLLLFRVQTHARWRMLVVDVLDLKWFLKLLLLSRLVDDLLPQFLSSALCIFHMTDSRLVPIGGGRGGGPHLLL